MSVVGWLRVDFGSPGDVPSPQKQAFRSLRAAKGLRLRRGVRPSAGGAGRELASAVPIVINRVLKSFAENFLANCGGLWGILYFCRKFKF